MDQQPNSTESKNKNLDQNQQEKPLSTGTSVALIGFIGGMFWSALAMLAYYFNFTEISPKVIISSWAADAWMNGVLGFFILIILYGLVSIIVAFIYYATLRKVRNIFASIFFGLVLWACVHFALVPLFPDMLKITEMTIDTAVTTICLYILYGVFIGVSISFDESERKRKKEVEKHSSEVQS